MGVHCVYACLYRTNFIFIYIYFFLLQLQDSHVLLLRPFFWFTIDHMVHSSCLRNTEKPGRSLAAAKKIAGRELAGKVLMPIQYIYFCSFSNIFFIFIFFKICFWPFYAFI